MTYASVQTSLTVLDDIYVGIYRPLDKQRIFTRLYLSLSPCLPTYLALLKPLRVQVKAIQCPPGYFPAHWVLCAV